MRKPTRNGIRHSAGALIDPADLNEPVDPNDRFAYGWRYIKTKLPDGSVKDEQIPLTLEDILHPQEDDFRVLTDYHTEDCNYLRAVFKSLLQTTPGAIVLSDCRVAWDKAGKYGHGPDVAVIFGVREHINWATFNVLKEGTRPSLIIEVTSPTTRSTDLIDKVREYAGEAVPHYVIADAQTRKGRRALTLIDYHLSPDSENYFTLPLSADGRVWMPELNLWLAIEGELLTCYDEQGKRQGGLAEERASRLKAERLAATAQRRAETAKRRADVAQLQADKAQQELANERQARLEAEQNATREREEMAERLRQMEERLRRTS